MNDFPQIIYKRHTFLSALAMGVSAVIIAFIVSCTVVIIYGMNFAGNKSEELVTLAEEAIRGLPEFQKSLPPVLADMLNDRRQPDYRTQLTITPKTVLLPADNGMVKTTIEIVNNGKQVVSFLSLRLVVLTSTNEVITESDEIAATPIAAGNERWRGPLMPGSRRYFVVSRGSLPVYSVDELKPEVEVTDLRIWNGEGGTNWLESRLSEIAKQPDPNSTTPTEVP